MSYAANYIRTGAGRGYIGTSTDWKPHRGVQQDGSTVTTTDLPVGSTFIELDTGKTAVFDGVEWQYLPRPARDDVVGKLDELLTAMKLLHETQERMLLLMSGS